MSNLNQRLAADMAFENNIDFSLAEQLTTWLQNEGIVDYDILKETYNGGE